MYCLVFVAVLTMPAVGGAESTEADKRRSADSEAAVQQLREQLDGSQHSLAELRTELQAMTARLAQAEAARDAAVVRAEVC